MANLVKKNTHLIDVNFVIPESKVKTLAKFQFLIWPLIGVGLLGAAASMHLGNVNEISRLNTSIETLQANIAEAIASDTEDLVGTFRTLTEERDELTATLEAWREAIPTPPDWRERYAQLLHHLPGIADSHPSITLSSLNASSQPTRKREDYGVSEDVYERIEAEFGISGSAKTKEDVTSAALIFQSSPDHTAIFTGTSPRDDGYTFNLTVSLLNPPPPEEPEEPEEETAL